MRIVMFVAALAIAAPAGAQVQGRPKVPVPLPEGRMLLIAGGGEVAHFIALDAVRRSGRSIESVILSIYDPGISVDGKLATHTANLTRFDCERRTSTEVGASAYAPDGTEVAVMPSGDAVPLSGVNQRIGQSLCGGMAAQPGYIVQGRSGAERLGRQVREGIRREEAAQPQPPPAQP